MKKRTVAIIAFLLAGLTALFGCSTQKPSKTGTIDLMAEIISAEWPEKAEAPAESFKASALDFSAALLNQAIAKGGNVLVSPASVYFALSMTLNGAAGETKDAMLKALSASGLTVEAINESCRNWITSLNASEKAEVAVADSIWIRDELVPNKDFLQTNADYFAAAARTLNFDDPNTVDIINGWVKEATRGTIDKIIDQIRQESMMYLINAVYFKANWQAQFDKNDNYDADFAAPGKTAQSTYMRRSGSMGYISDGTGAQGVILPYEGGQFAFFAILPPEGADTAAYVKSLSGESLNVLLSSAETRPIRLSLPKFETRYEDVLNDELSALGMGIAFSAADADFSPMTASGERELFIGEVRHKTFCRVDEAGTEASAVTSVEMRTTAVMPPEDEIILDFNRPFVYGITDAATGIPLFIGVMQNPAE